MDGVVDIDGIAIVGLLSGSPGNGGDVEGGLDATGGVKGGMLRTGVAAFWIGDDAGA
jgi:hypothetical protein